MTATKKQPIAGYRISDPSDPTIKPWLSDTPDDNGYTSEPLYAGAAPAAVAGSADERMPDEVLAAIRHAGLQLIRTGEGFRVEKAQQFTAAAAPALEAPAAPEPVRESDVRDMIGMVESGQAEEHHLLQFLQRLVPDRPVTLAAAPQAPAALEELRKIAAIAACWGCDHPDAPGDTETVRRIKWAARQLRAAAQAPAAPAVDAFTHAELLEIQRAVSEFEDCNETDVDDALLMRAVQAGYLECSQYFHVADKSKLDSDTAAAQAAAKGA